MTIHAPPAVDAHIHLWDLDRARYPWLDAENWTDIRRDYLPRHLAADLDGVDVEAVVHLEANVDPSVDPVEETAWLASLVDDSPELPPLVCIGYADLRAPNLEDVLARHAQHEIFRGVRQEVWHTDLLTDDAWLAGLRRVAASGLSFDLLASPDQLDRACTEFREIPELTVVIDHLAVPDPSEGGLPAAWRDGIGRFAREVPRSVLKISGFALIDPGWTTDGMGHIVREGLEVFGPERCMFGSNFPVDRLAASYARLWQAYDQLTADLSAGERAAVFSGTARRTYAIAS